VPAEKDANVGIGPLVLDPKALSVLIESEPGFGFLS
jgi:hypothetical protein